MEPPNRIPERAVIIGAGAAGLAAAAALSHYFTEILIVEKDPQPQEPSPRKSVPQSGHLHSVLLGGLALLNEFFPQIKQKLIAAGAITFKAGLEQHIYESAQWLPSRDLNMDIVSQSRPLLDHVMRQETQKIKNVKIDFSTRVEKISTDNQGYICGVMIKAKDMQTSQVDTQIVIDASGVSAIFVKQLAPDFPGIDSFDSVNSNVAYASATLAKPDGWLARKENVLIVPEPHQNSGGALLDIENDCWIVSLHGRHGTKPPSTESEWKQFSKTLPQQAIWERIKDAKIISKIRTFNKPVSTFRRYDRCKKMPIGYFPIGDTISSVNPIFGQGMAVAWGHVAALKRCFQSGEDLQSIQQKYIPEANKWSARAWRRAAFYDSLFEKAESNTSKDHENLRFLHKVAKSKLERIQFDVDEHIKLTRKAHMLDAVDNLVLNE